MSRQQRYLAWGLATVAGLFLVFLLVVPEGARVPTDIRRSSLRTFPDGVAGLARTLEAFGAPGVQRYDSYTARPPGEGVEVLLEPRVPPSAAEVASLLTWVRGGGTLVYAPDVDGELADSLGVSVTFTGSLPDSVRAADHRWASGLASPGDSSGFGSWELRPLGVDSGVPPDWTPLLMDVREEGESVSVAWMDVGEGGVLLLADAARLSNEVLADTPEAVVVIRAVVERAAGGPVAFSEFHQGFDGRGRLLDRLGALLVDTGGGRVAVHLAAVAFGLTLLFGLRFGRPEPLPSPDRRSPREHVDALARIYRSADARRPVAQRLIQGAARRAHRTLVPGSDAETAFLERALTGSEREAALRAWSAEPVDLLALARALDPPSPTSPESSGPT